MTKFNEIKIAWGKIANKHNLGKNTKGNEMTQKTLKTIIATCLILAGAGLYVIFKYGY